MISNYFFKQQILPAVTVTSTEESIRIAEALLAGGLNCMEITFRTKASANAIESIRKNFPEMVIGAGTLLNVSQIELALNVGAQFGLAPGFNPTSCKYAIDHNFPFIPGVFTPSEIEQAVDLGFNLLKLFPVNQAGGVSYLKALDASFQNLGVKFIPMGGIKNDNLNSYLQLDNVVAVGGSWLTPMNVIKKCDFQQITDNTKEALSKIKK